MITCSFCDFSFNEFYTQVKVHLLKIMGRGVRICSNVTGQNLLSLKIRQ